MEDKFSLGDTICFVQKGNNLKIKDFVQGVVVMNMYDQNAENVKIRYIVTNSTYVYEVYSQRMVLIEKKYNKISKREIIEREQ